MSYQFTISPDMSTRYLSGWYVFNTWMQKTLGEKIHLELFEDFERCRSAVKEGRVDLIYANPYDASMLVRDQGFVPIAHPRGRPDEVVIAVPADSEVRRIEDLRPRMRIATSTDPEVNVIGMIMLEAADLGRQDLTLIESDTYVLVAKRLLRHEVDAGFFMAESFHELSELTRKSLRVLLQSRIHVIHHMLLASPRMAALVAPLQTAVLQIEQTDKGKAIQRDLGFEGWARTDAEEAEFMVDLMETLT